MRVAEVVTALRERGARILLLDRDRIGVEPASALTDDLRRAIRAHKAEILVTLRAEAEALLSHDLSDASIHEASERLGAVLIRSPLYGEIWVALDPCAVPELHAEEQAREEPRPVLLAEDVARLRGAPPEAIQAVLAVAREWPGARVVQ